MTLLVSHFESASNNNQHPHYQEIEVAMAHNLQLPIIGELFVLLDSMHTGGCERFGARLARQTNVSASITHKLTCRQQERRLSYLELFWCRRS